MNKQQERTCPICGKVYKDYPAISRQDDKTEICTECGAKEAIAAMKNAKLADKVTVTMTAEITFVVGKKTPNFMLFDAMSDNEREMNFANFIKAKIFADDANVSDIKLFDSAPEVRYGKD